MKYSLTLFIWIGCSVIANAQSTGRTAADPASAFERDPTIYQQSRDRVSNQEAIVVLNKVRSEMQMRQSTNRSTAPKTLSTAEYQTLITKADAFFVEKKYEEAALLYQEIIVYRPYEQYSKDKLAQTHALQAKRDKERAKEKQDALIRSEAEFAMSKRFFRDVHFTGGVVSDVFDVLAGTTKALQDDQFSNMLGIGKYDTLVKYLPKADQQTFDGIVIPVKVRVVIYKDLHFSGDTLLDVTGPAIINNTIWQNHELYSNVDTKEFTEELQSFFPQETRAWSNSNMHFWNTGSMEIIYVAQ